jgi:hypothetical protein
MQRLVSNCDEAIKIITERKDFIAKMNIYNDKSLNATIKYEEDGIKLFEDIKSNMLYPRISHKKDILVSVEKNREIIKSNVYENEQATLEDSTTILDAMSKESEINQELIKADIPAFIQKLSDEHYEGLMKGLSIIKNQTQTQTSSSSNNYIPPTYYQPIVIPQIQIPKTTYCTMRGTGVNGTYDISCN